MWHHDNGTSWRGSEARMKLEIKLLIVWHHDNGTRKLLIVWHHDNGTSWTGSEAGMKLERKIFDSVASCQQDKLESE